MFTFVTGVVTGFACSYAGYNYRRILEQFEETDQRKVEVPKHSFLPETVQHYVEQRQEGDKYVLYSKYQQCELATH